MCSEWLHCISCCLHLMTSRTCNVKNINKTFYCMLFHDGRTYADISGFSSETGEQLFLSILIIPLLLDWMINWYSHRWYTVIIWCADYREHGPSMKWPSHHLITDCKQFSVNQAFFAVVPPSSKVFRPPEMLHLGKFAFERCNRSYYNEESTIFGSLRLWSLDQWDTKPSKKTAVAHLLLLS